VASYNIRNATSQNGADGVNGQDTWAKRKQPLANIIISHDFDIVGTQECQAIQYTDLKTLLPGYGHVVSGGTPTSIFYKTAKFEVLTNGHFYLSDTPDVESNTWGASAVRSCNWVRFKEKTANKEFYFFNSHFDHQSATANGKAARLIIQKKTEIAGNLPVIFTGDLNTYPAQPPVLTLLTAFRSAYDIAETPPAGPYSSAFEGGVFEGQTNPVYHIDYIFVSSHFRALDYATLTDSYNNGHYPSDHLPITSRLSIDK
jgi:endonuclease/exonuclease/phosphatase family metal-dependent hydrolase